MIITKISIVKFKNIEKLEINFTKFGNIISIIGLNNIGKTNILEAINFFETLEIKKIRKNEEREQAVSVSYKITLDDKKHFFNGYLKEMLLKEKVEIEKEKVSITNSKLVNKIKAKCEKNWEAIEEFVVDASWNKESNEFNYFFPEEIADSEYLYNEFYEKNKYTIKFFDKTSKDKFLGNRFDFENDNFKKILKKIGESDFINDFYEYNTIQLNEKIEKIEYKIDKFIFNDWNNDDRISKYSVKLSLENKEKGVFSLIINNKGVANGAFQPEESSEGLISIILMKLELEESLNKRIILIDEPNTFLHSSAQIKLLNNLKKIAENDDNKIIYTTHSEHFIDYEIPILYKNKRNWEIKKSRDAIEYQNIQLKALTNNLLINNPISTILEKEKNYYKFLELFNKKDYKISLTYIHNLLEKEINQYIYDLKLRDELMKENPKSSTLDKIQFIIDRLESQFTKISLNKNIPQIQLIELIKNNLKNIQYLNSFRNKNSIAHSNNLNDVNLKPVIPIIILNYITNIELLKNIRESSNIKNH